MGVVKSGYFKYVALNSKGQEVATGFSFEGDVVTDYVPIQEIASYLSISRRQLHRIREAESAADASDSDDI